MSLNLDWNNHFTIWHQMIKKIVCLTRILKITFATLLYPIQTKRKMPLAYTIDILTPFYVY